MSTLSYGSSRPTLSDAVRLVLPRDIRDTIARLHEIHDTKVIAQRNAGDLGSGPIN